MPTYIMLTKLSPEALTKPQAVEELGIKVTQKIHEDCPQVSWVGSYSLLGPYDYLDIFEAPDEGIASQVALIIRSFGHATTETWTATPWERYVELARQVA